MSKPKQGYTLPVFACAAAIAALRHLHQDLSDNFVAVNLIKPAESVKIAIEQVAKLNSCSALAITRSDPGEHLDITRNTPIWALVESSEFGIRNSEFGVYQPQIQIRGGEGIGRIVNDGGKAAIYSYAQKLIRTNLASLLYPGERVMVTIILPEGVRLAQRTSNSAFGVIEGLSLLGTTGIVQPLTASSQLEAYQTELRDKAQDFKDLIFCIGENGLDLAHQMGFNPARIVKTANWLGSMLVIAGLEQVKSIVLFGYHGKLIKLAGGIFHTHHHLADGRLEILTAHCAQFDLPPSLLKQVYNSPTTESALQLLREVDKAEKSNLVEDIYQSIVAKINSRTQQYIRKHTEQEVCIDSVLFDRQRNIVRMSTNTQDLISKLC